MINVLDLQITLHLTYKKKKKRIPIFLFQKTIFSIALIIEDKPIDSTVLGPVINDNRISKAPPIFTQTEMHYNTFCCKINELMDSSEFNFKNSHSIGKRLKLQANSSDLYKQLSNTSRIIMFHFTHTDQ